MRASWSHNRSKLGTMRSSRRKPCEAGNVTALAVAIIDLVIANRVLARIGAVDAYGHVSVRHPTQPEIFLLSRSRSPQLVERDEIMQFDLEGFVVGSDDRPPYSERFIHATIYYSRPHVHSVAHIHHLELFTFTVS